MTNHLTKLWEIDEIPAPAAGDHIEMLESAALKNMFIFGEDPVGCAVDKDLVAKWFNNAGFVMVQDCFMSETASLADLIMPASLPFETGGTYSNTGKVIQQYEKHFQPAVEYPGYRQLIALLKLFGKEKSKSLEDVRMEIFSVLSLAGNHKKHQLRITAGDNYSRMFNHGCDHIVMRFDKEFAASFDKVPNS